MTGFLGLLSFKDLVFSSIFYRRVSSFSHFYTFLILNVIFLSSCWNYVSVDLSPQDSTLVPDIVEVGTLSSYTREFDESHHCFYILTRQGLRVECSSTSKTQVNHPHVNNAHVRSWEILQHCNLDNLLVFFLISGEFLVVRFAPWLHVWTRKKITKWIKPKRLSRLRIVHCSV